MNRLIIQLIETTPSMDSFPQVRTIIKDQIQSLLTLFQEKDSALARATKAPSWEATQLTRVTKLIYELVSSLEALDDAMLSQMTWLTPMLGRCMQSRNETVRRQVLELQQRMIGLSGLDETVQPEAETATTTVKLEGRE
jgi:hypothetical protein